MLTASPRGMIRSLARCRFSRADTVRVARQAYSTRRTVSSSSTPHWAKYGMVASIGGWTAWQVLRLGPAVHAEADVIPHDDPVEHAIAHKDEPLSANSYGAARDYKEAIDELKSLWQARGREDDVSTDAGDLEYHGISAWSYHGEKRPSVVVWVESTEDVADVIWIAAKYRIPVTPFSGGTSLEGHFSAPFGGISIDMSRMNKILAVHEADGDVVVQSGISWEDLNQQLKSLETPLFFPLDPGPGATIGGMIATGSDSESIHLSEPTHDPLAQQDVVLSFSGTARAEWFINVTAVLPSGKIIKTRSRARKSSTGWDLTKMFIGAEGTLGIVTEATLRLAPRLPTSCAVVNFPDIEAAANAVAEIVLKGHPVQCVELVDDRMISAINEAGLSGRKYPVKDSIFLKFVGSPSATREVSEQVQQIAERWGGRDFEASKTPEESDELWQGRKTALWSAMAMHPDHRCWTTDVCVPISALAKLIRSTKADLERRGLTAYTIGHAGDGNCHMFILFKTDDELEQTKEAVHKMVEAAQALDGTASGEHGVGMGKIEYLNAELGEDTVELMESIKRLVDPHGIMNPGKLYPNLHASFPVAPVS